MFGKFTYRAIEWCWNFGNRPSSLGDHSPPPPPTEGVNRQTPTGRELRRLISRRLPSSVANYTVREFCPSSQHNHQHRHIMTVSGAPELGWLVSVPGLEYTVGFTLDRSTPWGSLRTGAHRGVHPGPEHTLGFTPDRSTPWGSPRTGPYRGVYPEPPRTCINDDETNTSVSIFE